MKVRKLDRRGKGYSKVEWILDYYEGPKRIRKWYTSKGDAEAAMDEIKGQHRVAGQAWVELPPEQRNELMTIYAEAEREKISLRTVWEAASSTPHQCSAERLHKPSQRRWRPDAQRTSGNVTLATSKPT